MFIIAAEIIASKIRQSDEIRGIELPSIDHDKREAKITQFADDTTIFVRDELSLCNVIKVLSGLHLNKTKSDAVWIGASKYWKKRVGGINLRALSTK